jgi:hypothetical protein
MAVEADGGLIGAVHPVLVTIILYPSVRYNQQS